MKVPIKVTIITGLLTLATWIFFYIVTPDAPLGVAATTVVAGFYLFLVITVCWVWKKFGRKGA